MGVRPAAALSRCRRPRRRTARDFRGRFGARTVELPTYAFQHERYWLAPDTGHTGDLGGAVGLMMVEAGQQVNQAYLDEAKWEVDIAGKLYPAMLSMKPLYDPENAKPRS